MPAGLIRRRRKTAGQNAGMALFRLPIRIQPDGRENNPFNIIFTGFTRLGRFRP